MSNSEKHPLQTVLEDTDHADRVRSYEGRGMYGKSCLSVTISCSLGGLFADVMTASVESIPVESDALDEVAEAFRTMRTDNMGHDTVVYFPGVTYVDDEEEDDGDEGQEDDECDG